MQQRRRPADAATSCTTASLGTASLFALGLAGAPINGLPINGLPMNGLPINGMPINGLPINGLDLSASPINGLPINGLPINGLLAAVVDCTKIDCTTKTLGDAAAAGALQPGATILDLLNLLLQTGSPVRATLTLGDVIGLLIKRSDVPWETLSPRLLSAFDPHRQTLPLTAHFTLQGTGDSGPATVKVTLPDGFDYVPSSRRRAASATPIGRRARHAHWTLTGVPFGHHAVDLRSRRGRAPPSAPAQATETVTSGGVHRRRLPRRSPSPTASRANARRARRRTITPDQNVEMSAIPSPAPSTTTRSRCRRRGRGCRCT